MALSTPKLQSKLMAHQTPNGGFGNAHPVSYSPEPEKPKEEKKETFDEDISLEEALSTL